MLLGGLLLDEALGMRSMAGRALVLAGLTGSVTAQRVCARPDAEAGRSDTSVGAIAMV